MAYGNIMGQTPQIDTSNLQLDASQIVSGTFSTSQIPNLNASKITSGILPVSRGGTGVTSYDSLKTKLGINGGGGWEYIGGLNNSMFGSGDLNINLNQPLSNFQEIFMTYSGTASSPSTMKFLDFTRFFAVSLISGTVYNMSSIKITANFSGAIHLIYIDTSNNIVLVNGFSGSNNESTIIADLCQCNNYTNVLRINHKNTSLTMTNYYLRVYGR